MKIDLKPGEIHMLAELMETAITEEVNTHYNVDIEVIRAYVHLHDKLKAAETEVSECLDL